MIFVLCESLCSTFKCCEHHNDILGGRQRQGQISQQTCLSPSEKRWRLCFQEPNSATIHTSPVTPGVTAEPLDAAACFLSQVPPALCPAGDYFSL